MVLKVLTIRYNEFMLLTPESNNRKPLIVVFGLILIIGIGMMVFAFSPFGAPQSSAEEERFVVPLDASQKEIAEKLLSEGFVKNTWAFSLIHTKDIAPGAYRLEKDMNVFAVSKVLKEEPYMKWVVIPEGYRKEQIAELMAEKLGWTDVEVRKFITKDTQLTLDTQEGVYFPDTYLIPVDESTYYVAERLHTRFNEKFEPYAKEAIVQNIRWPTLIKIASLIQREAAGESDMPLIAGILWNRLLNDQRLELDATVQYARDTVENYNMGDNCLPTEAGPCIDWVLTYHGSGAGENGWWRPIKIEDKKLDPFNTYIHKGLPNRPIANPGIKAIEAVLYPEKTNCFFYLHDSTGQIHCAPTYEEHQKNIEEYL